MSTGSCVGASLTFKALYSLSSIYARLDCIAAVLLQFAILDGFRAIGLRQFVVSMGRSEQGSTELCNCNSLLRRRQGYETFEALHPQDVVSSFVGREDGNNNKNLINPVGNHPQHDRDSKKSKKHSHMTDVKRGGNGGCI